MTNSDHLKSLSDLNLAQALVDFCPYRYLYHRYTWKPKKTENGEEMVLERTNYDYRKEHICKKIKFNCDECRLQWLREEYHGEEPFYEA